MSTPSGLDIERSSAAYDPEVATSASSRRLNRRGLDRVRWRHDGIHPGIPWAWKALRGMLRLSWFTQFRNREISGADTIDPDRGLVALAWHTAGLVDPMAIVQSCEKRFIMVGRHDLMTRPIIGRWARSIGSQPVLRQREIDEGTTDATFAREINHRSLLTVAHTISGGHGCVIMPEGTSQIEPRMMPLRSGPMRIALNAAAAAQARNRPLPSIRPVGLHFREAWKFRTDCYVEFGQEIPIDDIVDDEAVDSLLDGKWKEPDFDSVNTLRNRIKESLDILTPDADDWDEFHSWSVISHIEADAEKSPHVSWSSEVHGIRSVRDRIRSGELDSKIMEPASRIQSSLKSFSLDPRSISSEGVRPPSPMTWLGVIWGLSLMLLSAPLAVFTLPQALLAWYIGNNSDEGLDARSTFHILAVTFSPVLIWPYLGFAATASFLMAYTDLITWQIVAASMICSIVFMPLFHIANLIFLRGYDSFFDFFTSLSQSRFRRSIEGSRVKDDVNTILAFLK